MIAPKARAQAADFYRGKTIRMLIGAGPGGGYDIAGRLVAAHMGRHIPGEPTFVVENMQGASGLTMTNYLYNRVPRDGTVIGMPNAGIPLEPRVKLLTRAGGSANFDVGRLGWLGSSVRQTQVLYAPVSATAQSVDDLKRSKFIVGSESSTSDNYLYPFFMNRLLGAQIQIVPGYPGQTDIFLAVERGELQGCVSRYATLKVTHPTWLSQGKGRLLMQFGEERLEELKDVPTFIESAANEEDREMLKFWASRDDMACPLCTPPETPAERLQILRDAFDATMKDPAYVSAAERLGLDARPLDSKGVEKLMTELAATPEPVVQRLRDLLDAAAKR
jgi:tripartite-type tricarboxylate transporter receptor subunit TctC